MKLARFNGGRLGVIDGEHLYDITTLVGESADEWPAVGICRVIRDFDRWRPAIDALVRSGPALPLASVRLETPIPWPNKLLAYPVNYHDHATEMASRGLANIQGFFVKSNSSISGPNDAIEVPAIAGREVHHECEIAIVIGKPGRQIPVERALEHVFGYACLIDVTVRGKEERVMRKSFDTFTPIGPWIVTADEVRDPADIDTRLWVNDELRQSANTRDLIVDIPHMISIASSAATLMPGDVIASGTPAGVGRIQPGDVVRIDVAGVGQMAVPVVQSPHGASIVFDKPYEFVRAS